MYYLSDICSLCLIHNQNLKSILSKDFDGITVEDKLKVFLLELVNFMPNIQKYICENCLVNLNYVHKFRQKCLGNITTLSKYVQNSEVHKTNDLSRTLTETKYEQDPLLLENQINREASTSVNEMQRHCPQSNTSMECVFIKQETNLVAENNETVSTDDVRMKIEDIVPQQENEESCPQSNTVIKSLLMKQVPNLIQENNEIISPVKTEMEDNVMQHEKSFSNVQTPYEVFQEFNEEKHIIEGNQNITSNNNSTITERFHACPTCHKPFRLSSDLKRHVRIHTGEKPYTCDVCNKGFSQQSHLTDHKRIHDNVRPFKCPVCDEAFTQSGSVSIHMRKHTKEKPFHCHLCEYKCTTGSNLRIHVRAHMRGKPFSCRHCPKSFVAESSLDRHMQRSHKEKLDL